MKQIIQEIKEFIKEEFNIWIYSYTIVFLATSIILNYTLNFENRFIDSMYGKPAGMFIYIPFYGFAYFSVLIPLLLVKKRIYKLKQVEFWVKIIVILTIFSASIGFYQFLDLISEYRDNYKEYFYLFLIISNLKRIIPFILVFYVLKRIYDKDINHLYGFRYKGINYRPFFALLAIVAPLIIWASFFKSFQVTYPQFKFWNFEDIFGLSSFQSITFFEIAYGLDFISIELLFRGALIIGMTKVLGKDAILPMAAMYVFIHFGKPPGEAISSFFGGFILGVHSYYRKNIFAGIVIHIGIAYLMEIAAISQHLFNN